METDSKHWRDLPFYLSLGVAAATMVSIAATHILLGVSLLLLFVRYRDQLRLPPVWPLIALFMVGTAISLALSDHPRAGLPQLKKFYVWCGLLVIYSGVRTVSRAAAVLLAMAGAATISASWGLVQFAIKYQRAAAAGKPFYQAYVADRITGTANHWQTFSGQMMIALLILCAYVLFRRRSAPAGFGIALMSAALLLAFTRGQWGGAAAGVMFLILMWRPWALLALPLVGAAVLLTAPAPVRQRIESAWNPDKRLDSNQHRAAMRETGYRMIAAYPWFGVGPEQVGPHVTDYAPPEVPRPLPKEWYVLHLHNIYLQFAAERGIPVALCVVGMLVVPLVTFLRAVRRKAMEQETRFALLAVSAGVIALMVAGWWEHNLGDSEVLSCFVALLACGYSVVSDPAALKV